MTKDEKYWRLVCALAANPAVIDTSNEEDVTAHDIIGVASKIFDYNEDLEQQIAKDKDEANAESLNTHFAK